MFSRFVKYDDQSGVIFPFQSLSHSFLICDWKGTSFDPKKELDSNKNLRLSIQRMKDGVIKFVDRSNLDAIRKSEHYLKALDDQLAMCDKTDEFILTFGGLKRN
jgi:hypothetical protein